ncbi:hypothetical protein [Flaviflagellibacter deserti]|uniref:Uncharacterized protein n=1 Tax=Flaviflagellibacter deserti TaxID=2267266 RepID=A0ABV9Z6W9_9HYPH
MRRRFRSLLLRLTLAALVAIRLTLLAATLTAFGALLLFAATLPFGALALLLSSAFIAGGATLATFAAVALLLLLLALAPRAPLRGLLVGGGAGFGRRRGLREKNRRIRCIERPCRNGQGARNHGASKKYNSDRFHP